MEGLCNLQFGITPESLHHRAALSAACLQLLLPETAQPLAHHAHIEYGHRHKGQAKQRTGQRLPYQQGTHHQQYQHSLARHAEERSQHAKAEGITDVIDLVTQLHTAFRLQVQ